MKYVSMRLPASALLIAVALGSQPAFAQQGTAATPPAQLPSPEAPATTGGDAQSRQGAQLQGGHDKYTYLNKFLEKGWITPVPSVEDTLTQDTGGWRSALAKAGFGFSVYAINTIAYDVAKAGKAANLTTTQYNGQHLVASTAYQTATLTFDTGKLGLHGGQIVLTGQNSVQGYTARNGPQGIRLKEAYYYQSLAHGKVELELGILPNAVDFIGVNVGGSLAAGALGPQATIPAEVGQSLTTYGTPTANIKINWTPKFYTRSAVQRSISPQGVPVEDAAVPGGIGFGSPGASALLIQEVGYRVPSSDGVKNFWIRGGGYYNFSDYKAFLGGTRHNHAEYIAADRQLTQPDHGQPGRGFYIGATIENGDAEVDAINQYYEGRAYWKGPLDSRPNDMFSIVADYNGYGAQARKANAIGGFRPFTNTQAYTTSYSFHIIHGFFLQPGLQVIVHPVYNRNVGTAVNGLLSIVTFL